MNDGRFCTFVQTSIMKVNYNGKEFGSWEEVYFLWFCEDLKRQGLIKRIIHNSDEDLTQPVIAGKKKLSLIIPSDKAKTKNPMPKFEERSLLQPMVYTPDYKLEFSENTQFLLVDPYLVDTGALFMASTEDSSLEVFVEIKPSITFKGQSVGSHDSMRRFSVVQKVVFDMKGQYINLVKSPEIFKQTFIPTRFFFCDKKSSQRRKINYPVKTLDNFIKDRKEFLRIVSSNQIKKDETNIRASIQKVLTR